MINDMCLSGRGTHMSRDMCLPGRGTHITRATHGKLTERAFPRVGNLTWPPS